MRPTGVQRQTFIKNFMHKKTKTPIVFDRRFVFFNFCEIFAEVEF